MVKTKRNNKIWKLRQKDLTYQKIGDGFHISRQRVHQIVKRSKTKYKMR